jgi:RES domain-containing protein
MAESPAGALLEALVHLTSKDDPLPRTFTLLEIEAAEDLSVEDLMPLAGADWKESHSASQTIGDAWIASFRSPLGRVPSAIVPRTSNLLLNPLHPDAGKMRIVSVIHERFDPRLRLKPR